MLDIGCCPPVEATEAVGAVVGCKENDVVLGAVVVGKVGLSVTDGREVAVVEGVLRFRPKGATDAVVVEELVVEGVLNEKLGAEVVAPKLNPVVPGVVVTDGVVVTVGAPNADAVVVVNGATLATVVDEGNEKEGAVGAVVVVAVVEAPNPPKLGVDVIVGPPNPIPVELKLVCNGADVEIEGVTELIEKEREGVDVVVDAFAPPPKLNEGAADVGTGAPKPVAAPNPPKAGAAEVGAEDVSEDK